MATVVVATVAMVPVVMVPIPVVMVVGPSLQGAGSLMIAVDLPAPRLALAAPRWCVPSKGQDQDQYRDQGGQDQDQEG